MFLTIYDASADHSKDIYYKCQPVRYTSLQITHRDQMFIASAWMYFGWGERELFKASFADISVAAIKTGLLWQGMPAKVVEELDWDEIAKCIPRSVDGVRIQYTNNNLSYHVYVKSQAHQYDIWRSDDGTAGMGFESYATSGCRDAEGDDYIPSGGKDRIKARFPSYPPSDGEIVAAIQKLEGVDCNV